MTSKDTDMTIQERLRHADDPTGVNAGFNDMVASHIDQLEADKAELLDVLAVITHSVEELTEHLGGGYEGSDLINAQKLLAKHRS